MSQADAGGLWVTRVGPSCSPLSGSIQEGDRVLEVEFRDCITSLLPDSSIFHCPMPKAPLLGARQLVACICDLFLDCFLCLAAFYVSGGWMRGREIERGIPAVEGTDRVVCDPQTSGLCSTVCFGQCASSRMSVLLPTLTSLAHRSQHTSELAFMVYMVQLMTHVMRTCMYVPACVRA